MHKDPIKSELGSEWVARLMRYGSKGNTPNTMNANNVTMPLIAGELSSTASPSYSSIMIFTKACLLRDMSSANRL
jgi:hypothetical protein